MTVSSQCMPTLLSRSIYFGVASRAIFFLIALFFGLRRIVSSFRFRPLFFFPVESLRMRGARKFWKKLHHLEFYTISRFFQFFSFSKGTLAILENNTFSESLEFCIQFDNLCFPRFTFIPYFNYWYPHFWSLLRAVPECAIADLVPSIRREFMGQRGRKSERERERVSRI